jgi:hypothetical protein
VSEESKKKKRRRKERAKFIEKYLKRNFLL